MQVKCKYEHRKMLWDLLGVRSKKRPTFRKRKNRSNKKFCITISVCVKSFLYFSFSLFLSLLLIYFALSHPEICKGRKIRIRKLFDNIWKVGNTFPPAWINISISMQSFSSQAFLNPIRKTLLYSIHIYVYMVIRPSLNYILHCYVCVSSNVAEFRIIHFFPFLLF